MIGSIAKRSYVTFIRGLRWPADKLGLLKSLESTSSRGAALWLRSLFAIYDLEDLVTLNMASMIWMESVTKTEVHGYFLL
jgi:hypothetical protein